MPRRHSHPLLVCCGLLAAWLSISAIATGNTPTAHLALVGLAVAAFLVGQLLRQHSVPSAVLLVVTVLAAVAASEGALTGSPTAGPLGYANANGALYVQAAGAAALAGSLAASSVARLGAVLMSAVLVALAAVSGSLGAVLTGLPVIAAATMAASRTPIRVRGVVWAAWAAVASVAVAVVASVCLALTSAPPAMLTDVLTHRRVALWSDAVEIALLHPVVGAGPGTFSVVSPSAQIDDDTRQAHSAYLQQAAETGIPGGVLLLALVVAPLLSVRGLRTGTTPAFIGVVTWSALALHASVDYVAHFPAVVAAATFILGLTAPLQGEEATGRVAHRGRGQEIRD